MIDLLLTDPPYNVAVENSQGMKIENDNMSDEEFIAFLRSAFNNAYRVMKDGAAYYVWYASKTAVEFFSTLKESGLTPRQQLIWIKSHFTLGRQDYQWQHEPCLYGWKEGAGHYFIDIHSFATIIGQTEIDKLDRESALEKLRDLLSFTTTHYEKKPAADTDHPTMKPVPLFQKLIRNSSREGENVLDLFGGSGTTLIACEEMNRNAYLMEYNPKYAEVIIRRWEEFTGLKAEKE